MKNISISLAVAGMFLISTGAVAEVTDEVGDCTQTSEMGDCAQSLDVNECFQTLKGGRKYDLTQDLECGCGDDPANKLPAITVTDDAELDLNGNTVSCSTCVDPGPGIVVQGDGAVVENGEVRGCERGLRAEGGRKHRFENLTLSENRRSGLRSDSSDSEFINNRAYDNVRRGLRIEGSNNKVLNNHAWGNGRQGIIIEGNDNEVAYNTANRNCRDGIEIDAGDAGADKNELTNNIANGNGNPDACAPADEAEYQFGIDYRPWFYAGINITGKEQSENVLSHNTAKENLGCWVPPNQRVEPDSNTWGACIDGFDPTTTTLTEAVAALRNRNLWDENAQELADGYKCTSNNEWVENRSDGESDAEPECPCVVGIGKTACKLAP